MIDTVSYSDRFEWMKLVQRQPKTILTADTKNVLTTLFLAFDKDKDSKTIHYRTIAEASGLTEEGVRGCVKRARKAGFIRSVGKGGFIRSEDGEVTGLACTFWMLIPPGLANPGDAAARVDQTAYPVQPTALPGLASTPTRFGQTANTSFSSSLIPTLSSSVTASAERGSEGQVLAFDAVSSWGQFWPKVSTGVEAINPDGAGAWVRSRFDQLCMTTLGFEQGVPRGPSEQRNWSVINVKLQEVEVDPAMLDRYRAGQLTNVDVATYLAGMGFVPPNAVRGVAYAQAS